MAAFMTAKMTAQASMYVMPRSGLGAEGKFLVVAVREFMTGSAEVRSTPYFATT